MNREEIDYSGMPRIYRIKIIKLCPKRSPAAGIRELNAIGIKKTIK